ncbi:Uncharacterised protein [Vibrio cholerae]|nr:Uncharacterised protein [Vibrio cholerae]
MSAAQPLKNITHAQLMVDHTASGKVSSLPSIPLIAGLPMIWLMVRPSAKTTYTIVTFHLMKLSSCRAKVMPPNRATITNVMSCIFSTFLYIA